MKNKIFFNSKSRILVILGIIFLKSLSVNAQTYSPCFSQTGNYSTGTSNRHLKKADFNNDGNIDIAISGSYWSSNTGALLVYLGNGIGGFSGTPNYTHNLTSGSAFCISDFNSDGKQDIAVLNSSNSLRVLNGNGNGTFTLASAHLTPSCSAICTSDFNNDSKPDIAVTGGNGSITILNNTGAGVFTLSAFQATTSVPSSYTFFDIITDDFNNDGKNDLIVNDNYLNNMTLLGNGNGTFASPITFNSNGLGKPVSVDINNDGNKDIVISNFSSGIKIFHGNGAGNFILSNTIAAAQLFSNVIPLDVNTDGYMDLCYSNYTQMVFILGDALGTYTDIATFNTNDANQSIIDVSFNSNTSINFITAESSYFSVLLNQKPIISGGPTVCSGQSATLTAFAGSSSCYWQGAPGPFNSIVVSPTVNTTYTAIGSSFNCPNNFSTITLTVLPLPALSVTAPSSTVCAGNSIVLTASGVVTYTWGQGLNTSSISVSPNVNTVYTVLGTDNNDCSNSASISVNVEACVGLPDRGNRLLQSIHLYPNPTTNTLFFSLKDIVVSVNNPIEIEVLNSIGKSQLKSSSSNADTFIDVSNLASGIYFLKVSLGKNEQACIKFSKL